jgi:hypothetical protein
MTAARQYFKTAGWGSIKRCAIETGYNLQFLTDVISHRRKCSTYTAKCISIWSKGALSINDFLIGKVGIK